MDIEDWDIMFDRVDSLDKTTNKKVNSVIPDDVGRKISGDDYIDYEEKIRELKDNAKEREREYQVLIDKLDLADDEAIELFTKQELTKSIIVEQSLASKVATMLDIVLLQMQKDPLVNRTGDFIQMVELQTKINNNVVKFTEKVNKIINDRKNAERQDLKVHTMINNKTENTNLLLGKNDDVERVFINMSDLNNFAKTGEIEAVKQIDVKEENEFEIIE